MGRLGMWAGVLAMSCAAAAQDGLGGRLPPAPPPPADLADPIAPAFAGLIAEVEDDLTSHDAKLVAIVTSGCKSQLRSTAHNWSIDWGKMAIVSPGDSFVFIRGPGVQMAIVGDAGQPDQAAKLSALHMAMRAMQQRCGGPPM